MKIPVLRNASRILMLGLSAVLLSLTATAASVDPATLVTQADVEKLLGQPVPPAHSSPAKKDEDSGGMRAHCSYRAGTAAVSVFLITFSSPQEALAKTTAKLAAGRLKDDNATIAEEKDLGDRAFWGEGENAAMFTVIKGSNVLGIVIGGKPPQPLASYRPALRAITVSALARL